MTTMPLEQLMFWEGGQKRQRASQETCHRVVRREPGIAQMAGKTYFPLKRHFVGPPLRSVRGDYVVLLAWCRRTCEQIEVYKCLIKQTFWSPPLWRAASLA